MSSGSVSDPEEARDAAAPCEDERRVGMEPARVGSEGRGRRGRSERDGGRQNQRSAANARERARMRVLSRAFCRLKTSLPWVPADTKLSKLDTLRLASSYISHLRHVLQQEERLDKPATHPLNLTWPFVVSGRPEDNGEVSTAIRLCGATA